MTTLEKQGKLTSPFQTVSTSGSQCLNQNMTQLQNNKRNIVNRHPVFRENIQNFGHSIV
jgi:hypothetical protein